jgi:N-acyl homoserine lactone hydrolase
MKCTIAPLYFGQFKNFEKSRFTLSKDVGVLIDVAILAYLVKRGDELILVDSGTPEPKLAETMDNCGIFEGRSIIDILAEIDLTPQDINTVILTHVHWDHAYNLNYFKHAKIYVQLSELQYAVKPLWLDRGPYRYSKEYGNPCWFEGFTSMEIMEGDFVLNEDISVYHLPGHTPGMQGVLVNTDEGKYMITSDNMPLYDNYESMRPTAVHVSIKDWYGSYQKIKTLADFILPGHDMLVLKRKAYGIKE